MSLRAIRWLLWSAAVAMLAATLALHAPRWQEIRYWSADTLRVSVETVAHGLEHPWSLAFLPDGSRLVTERQGRLRHVSAQGVLSPPVSGLPAIVTGGQAGLFDVLPDPDFRRNRLIYLSYAEADAQGRNGLAVLRAVLSPDLTRLEQPQIIFRQSPKSRSQAHYGGRLVFGHDGLLFITVGERFSERERAQDLGSHHGKIVRIRPDGGIPPDNPFARTAGALPEIWSLGHRNPQGAALHPLTGELWASEHGPQGGDEINRILPGKNYGWPLTSHGCEYGSCAPIGNGIARTGLMEPLIWWGPRSTAPSGLVFYQGTRYGDWRGDLFSGSLAGKTLWRLKTDGHRIVGREALLTTLGQRLRDVREGPDGYLYLLTDEDNGRILRVIRH